MMTAKLGSPKWLLIMSLNLVAVFLNQVISLADAGLVTSNSVLSPYQSLSPKDMLQRRLLKGREVIPPMSSNVLQGEPTCEELRAMWRYYKRQSRADLTNEVPRFGTNIFWDIRPVSPQQPHISSFAPIKGRSRTRLKLKPKSSAYGRMTYKQEKERLKSKPLRPMEQVAQMMGKGPVDETKEKGPLPDAIVHYSPPPTLVPTTPSSFQQIKEEFREERIREKAPVMRPNEGNGKTFGRIILGPPRGMDGRIANKPKELMTPFEKIRFGHADDLLEEGSKLNMNLMAKRRTPPIQALKMSRYQNPQQVFVPRSPRFMPVEEEEETSQWMDIVDTDALEMGEDGGGNLIDNRWASSLPLGVSLEDQQLTMRNPGKLVFLEMQQSQPFQAPKTFSSFPISDLPSPMDNGPTCQEVEAQPCRVNTDCSCVGYGLYRCYMNQCQTFQFSPPGTVMEEIEGDRTSLWHSGPVESSKLGLWEDANLNVPQSSGRKGSPN